MSTKEHYKGPVMPVSKGLGNFTKDWIFHTFYTIIWVLII